MGWSPEAWMKDVDGKKSLAELNIPGTHDTMTGHLSATYRKAPLTSMAATNDQPLDEQLNRGIRFIDIRCRSIDDRFAIHHGKVYLNVTFEDVLRYCARFLDAHGDETIIMLVNGEHTTKNCTLDFGQIFAKYMGENAGNSRTWGSYFLQSSAIPTLDQARGKIVLLRRVGGIGFGLDLTAWNKDENDNNPNFEIAVPGAKVHVQDRYGSGTLGSKWADVVPALDRARDMGPRKDHLWINFTSGTGIIPAPNAVATEVNALLRSYLKADSGAFLGTIVLDYPFDDRTLAWLRSPWTEVVEWIATRNPKR